MMKKALVSIFVMALAAMVAQAQTIRSGSKWWDGSVLYTAKVDEFGKVAMEGIGAHEGGFRFSLSKVEDYKSPYCLSADAPDAILPVRGELGWDVDYIRKDGMNFLAIRKPNGDVCHTLVLTPDNLQNCLAQEKFAEEQPVSDIITSMLLNTTYLGKFSKRQLRLMRNEILARHGWQFQSEDLRNHFMAQSWYKPGNDNNEVKLNIIEQTNLQLIKSEETVPDDQRSYQFTDQDFPGGLADDGRGPDEIDGEEVYVVENEDQFLASLGNDRVILIGDNVHLNLSRVLENEVHFKSRAGRKWSGDATAFIGRGPLAISESETDGRQLALVNFSQLVIRGGKNASIEVDPRYSYCLYFINCDHCEVQNLAIGHTEYGTCSGGVIGVRGGRQNQVIDCDLYGCGTYGLDLIETTDFSLTNSNIRNCTYGIMEMRGCTAVRFTTCDFFHNREYGLITANGCMGVSFVDCRFYANDGDAKLFDLDDDFYMDGCFIYHPTENLGSVDMATQKDNWFSPNPLDTNISPRGTGPKRK